MICQQCDKLITDERDHETITHEDDSEEHLCSQCYEARQEAGWEYAEHYGGG
jgi:tRNA(Ile)-lysidine synthase TilS/MesJ